MRPESEAEEEYGMRSVRGFSPAALRNARRAARLSQAELAVAADLSVTTIINWEKGIARPTAPRLQAVAEALGLQLADLAYLPPEQMNLADVRTSRGLTVATVAAGSGMSGGTISRIERGFSRPSEATIERLADFYDLDETYLRESFDRTRAQAEAAARRKK